MATGYRDTRFASMLSGAQPPWGSIMFVSGVVLVGLLLVGCSVSEGNVDDEVQNDTLDAAAVPGEIMNDVSLEDSSLESVVIDWATEIELCVRSPIGASISDVREYKAQFLLPPQVRGGLSLEAFSEVSLVGAVVERSPFSKDHHWPNAVSEVNRWELRREDGKETLLVTIDHRLDLLGTLTESYEVVRRTGETRNVVVDGVEGEVSFSWRPEGLASGHGLAPCAVEGASGAMIDVVASGGGDGSRVLLRVHQSALEGVYPVATYWLGDVLDYWPASGFWAHNHGLSEDGALLTEVDFALDLATWQLMYRPDAELAQGLERRNQKVRYLERRGEGMGGFIEETRVNADGSTSTFAFEAVSRPQRVDEAFLRSEYPDCGSLAVGALWGWQGEPVVQLAFCSQTEQGSTKQELQALVPIGKVFSPDVVGQVYAGSAIERLVDRQGWAVRVGHHDVVVEAGEGSFEFEVRDSTGRAVTIGRSDLVGLRERNGEQEGLHLSSSNGDVEFRLVRLVGGARGVGSLTYVPVEASLKWGERRLRVRAWDAMEYRNTHHNWDDSMTARTAEGDVIRWRYDSFDLESGNLGTHRIGVTNSAGEEVLEEVVVYPVGPGDGARHR